MKWQKSGEMAKCLLDTLQSPNLDLGLAVDLVDALVQTLKDCREETFFEEPWREVVHTAKQYDIDIEPIAKRKRKQNKRLDDGHVMSPLGQHPEQNRDIFRTGIFYPVLDKMLTEINRRFSKQNCEVMKGIQALNPTHATFCDERAIFSFASIYECNIEELGHELHQLKRILERKAKAGIATPSRIEGDLFIP